jgi:acetyl esterase/lipase
MKTKHLVDPQLLSHLDSLAPIDLSPSALDAFRALFTTDLTCGLIPEDVLVEDRIIPGPAGAPPVSVRLIQPAIYRPDRPAILHMHGGGYVAGCARNADEQNVAWAQALDCIVVSVDYRLSPETPAPGGVEDCYAALFWLHAEADSLGVNRRFIAIAGESAGGGLAAALCLLARDRGAIPVCHQLLTYPMLDDRTTATRHPICGEFLWTPELNAIAWKAYLGHEPNVPGVSPYAAPARAATLAGLPPTFIAVGSLDLFFDENLRYIQRLCAAGVQVELHAYPGAYHGFNNLKHSDMYRRYTADRLMALRRAFGIGSPPLAARGA